MLFTTEVKDMKELMDNLSNIEINNDGEIKVAAVCFIFDKDGKLILHRRGLAARDEIGKLQAIGGSVNNSDLSFIEALKRELVEEAGDKAVIDNFEFIAAQMDSKMDNNAGKLINWIILAYKGTLESGELINMEPTRCVGFEKAYMEEFNKEDLSTTAEKYIDYMLSNK